MQHHAFTPDARAHRAWQAGRQLAARGRWRDAAERYRAAHRLQPEDPLYPMLLGQALLKLEDTEGALQAVSAAARLQPDSAPLVYAQAECLRDLKRHEELVALLQSVPAKTLSADSLKLLGEAQVHLGRPREAVHTWLRALTHDPADAKLHLRLGAAFSELRLKEEAAECMKTALALGATESEVMLRDMLYLFEREVCEWHGSVRLEELKQAVRHMPDDAVAVVNPFVFATLCEDPLLNLKAARINARFMQGRTARLPARPAAPRPRIRLGYVSCDFYTHATSLLMAELLESHDRSRFEVFLYSHGLDDRTDVSRRIQAACEHFVDLHDATLPEMARRVRSDGIDILVDLKGYTKDSRVQMFAARPAPIQVSYLGFPGSSGAEFIDYIVGDPWVTPLAHADRYSEKIAQMPLCYQCNDGQRAIPRRASRADHGLPEHALVLCGFNQPFKISPEVLDSWCRILHRLPDAVLWLLEWGERAPAALRREAARRGVGPERLVFAPLLPVARHLDRMACADLFLDTWPCNGHTTASDALWAGLPVVTWSGEVFASRVAGSLVRAVGVPELVSDSLEGYETLAVDLGLDARRRASCRSRIEAARLSSPLFSGRAAARDLEGLFDAMWQRALAGLAPDHLPAGQPMPQTAR